MPSAGVLPWLQGLMCNIENPCLNYPTPGETPGQVNNFNNSIIAGILIELQTSLVNKSVLSNARLLMNDVNQWSSVLSLSNPGSVTMRSVLTDNQTFTTYLTRNLSVSPTVVQSLMNAQLQLTPMMGIPRPDNMRSILCEGTNLDKYVQFSSQTEREAFQNVSCSLTQQQLINAQQVFLQNLDGRKVFSGFPSALGLNATDTMALMRTATTSALPVIEEVVRLQNSMVFKAANSLDFQDDVMGSINMLLCGTKADNNSTKMS
ncbi:retinal-specific ATP-binding cassette transporter, partial [Austrofundulus limnaeus]|uniref:Retinal-specific ATP-binding cassette transporter n=1 Tax=Austrofundulus limnaeus TaxID=52670 RepID=A0A2I4DC52_AUSLI